MSTWIAQIVIGFLTLAFAAAASAEGPRVHSRGFDANVAPILARRCLDCHSGSDPKGKLDLSNRARALAGGKSGPAIVAGKLEESPLWERVESDEMPPKAPLPASEKASLREWIASGASWGTDPIDPYQVTTSRRAGRDWWSLQPVRRPAIPTAPAGGCVRSPVDAFVLQKLEAAEFVARARSREKTAHSKTQLRPDGLAPHAGGGRRLLEG